MKKYRLNNNHKDYLENLNKVIKPYYSNKNMNNNNLWIYGTVGVGKTFTIQKIIENRKNINLDLKEKFESKPFISKKKDNVEVQIYIDSLWNYEFVGFNKFIQDLMDNWKSGEKYVLQPSDLKKIKNLVIDDIGTENLNSSTYGYLLNVLEYRFINKNNQMTIFTSNYSVDEYLQNLKTKLSSIEVERISSRLKGLVDKELLIEGVDHRCL